jgi:hypothetical protein
VLWLKQKENYLSLSMKEKHTQIFFKQKKKGLGESISPFYSSKCKKINAYKSKQYYFYVA